MRNNFVVYAHYTLDTNELFYIGEGTNKRAYSKWSRNRYWKYKVQKHGFRVEILYKDLTKEQAEQIEKSLIIKYRSENINLVNFCIGPAFENHWLLNAPKEAHPMYGRKRPDISERMKNWNKERSGEKSPTFGLKRPDLAERNKLRFNNKPIICVETGEIFESIKKASEKYGCICRKALTLGQKSRGFHWKYITVASTASEVVVEQSKEVA